MENQAGLIFSVASLSCAVAIFAICIVRRRLRVKPPTLDDVMNNPHEYFHDSKWDPIVATLVLDESVLQAYELCPTPGRRWTFMFHQQERKLWDTLNQKLTAGEPK